MNAALEQRQSALRKANEVRLRAAQTKREVHALSQWDGAERVAVLLETRDESAVGVSIGRLLMSIRYVGWQKCGRLLSGAGRDAPISRDRRVGDLPDRQVRALASMLRRGAW